MGDRQGRANGKERGGGAGLVIVPDAQDGGGSGQLRLGQKLVGGMPELASASASARRQSVATTCCLWARCQRYWARAFNAAGWPGPAWRTDNVGGGVLSVRHLPLSLESTHLAGPRSRLCAQISRKLASATSTLLSAPIISGTTQHFPGRCRLRTSSLLVDKSRT